MKNVTVIVPSYNRAHLLTKTIPSYIQPFVKEIIVVNDGSVDNTIQVLNDLKHQYPIIRYLSLSKNSGQTTAKNTAIDLVTTDWIYFGDDDSVLKDGSVDKLMATALKYRADIVGARALYMRPGEEEMDIGNVLERHDRIGYNYKDIIDLNKFIFDFGMKYPYPIQVPFCHACILCKTQTAKEILFDVGYKGNAFREETDFIVRCSKKGATIFYDSEACQLNLPMNISSGGTHKFKKIRTHYYFWIKNNWRFLRRNWDFLREKYGLKKNKYTVQFIFIKNLFIPILKNRIINMIRK